MMQICCQLLYTHHTEIRVGMLGRSDNYAVAVVKIRAVAPSGATAC